MSFGNYGTYGSYYPPAYYTGAVPDALAQYKGQYQPQMGQPAQPVQPGQPAQQNSGSVFNWVQGAGAAKSYPVAPGHTVILWDSENPTVYIKSADPSGLPSMRILDWTERPAEARTPGIGANPPPGEFVTIDAFNALRGEFQTLAARFDSLTAEKEEENNG